MDPYDTLGIKPGSSHDQIRQRYKALVLEYHPDRNDAPDAGRMLQNILDAYQQILDDPTQGGTIKVQSAKYTRKDPRKQGRAAKKQARRQSGQKHKSKCRECDGLGVIVQARKVWKFINVQDTKFCQACGGRGKI